MKVRTLLKAGEMNCIQQESKRSRAEWQSCSAAKGGGEQTEQEPGNPFPAAGTRSWECTKATWLPQRCDKAAVLGVWEEFGWGRAGRSRQEAKILWIPDPSQLLKDITWEFGASWGAGGKWILQGLATGIIFPPPTSKPMCTPTGRVVKWMGKGKIQKGLRRDGTELASGILSTIIKRTRGQSSKRTQREGKRKCALGCTTRSTQHKLEEFFLAPLRDCQGHFGRCVSQHTKKSLEQHRNKRQRERGFKKCLRSLMN